MKIRLAETGEEIRVAQHLRHDVFVAERCTARVGQNTIDADKYDADCAHLLVIEPQTQAASRYALDDGSLVATARLIGQREAQSLGGFYSADEFELAPLLARHPQLKFLELGRTCILKHARGTAVMELLWQGIWDFVRRESYDVMIGCASFEGTDPTVHAAALSFLSQNAKPPEEWQAKTLPNRNAMPPLALNPPKDAKRILAGLPPLIKGYLRLGCYIGEGCVVDQAFNTVDVLVILPVKSINPRYFARFGAPA
ncbi:MAG TPA: GNAT family N-acyltransferase [Aestuariivirga sp.]